MLISACESVTRTARPAGGQASNPATTAPAPLPSAVSPPAKPAPPPAKVTPPRRAPAQPPRLYGNYLPLWPFATGQQVQAWQRSYLAGGHQAWHLSAGQTALGFTQGYLGYTKVNRVVYSRVSGVHARVAVGYSIPEGRRVSTAAVIHLVRFGSGRVAPWEVVGTDDTTLSLTIPAYGARVSSPVKVGGRLSGVDEYIRVQVRQLSSASPIGGAPGLMAGGMNQPWSVTATFRGGSGRVLTIAAATGGHLAAVERFAITGVVR
jgi:hypothetical protein